LRIWGGTSLSEGFLCGSKWVGSRGNLRTGGIALRKTCIATPQKRRGGLFRAEGPRPGGGGTGDRIGGGRFTIQAARIVQVCGTFGGRGPGQGTDIAVPWGISSTFGVGSVHPSFGGRSIIARASMGMGALGRGRHKGPPAFLFSVGQGTGGNYHPDEPRLAEPGQKKTGWAGG